MTTPKEQQIINKLDAMTIEEARQAIAKAEFGHGHGQDYMFASRWLSAKEASLRDSREAETLSVAKEANRIASEAKDIALLAAKSASKQARWAMWAAIIATIAIIIAAMTYIKTSTR